MMYLFFFLVVAAILTSWAVNRYWRETSIVKGNPVNKMPVKWALLGIVIGFYAYSPFFVPLLFMVMEVPTVVWSVSSAVKTIISLLLLVFAISKLIEQIKTKKSVPGAVPLYGFVIGTYMLQIFALPFSMMAQKLLIPSVLVTVFVICKIVAHKKKYQRWVTAAIVAVGISAACNIGFFFQLPNAGIVTRRENHITDITYVYNEDGTIKHNKDGSKVTDTEYERRTVRSAGNNWAILLFPLGGLITAWAATVYLEDDLKEKKQ